MREVLKRRDLFSFIFVTLRDLFNFLRGSEERMDFYNQSGNNGDEQDDQASNNPRMGKKLYHRHTVHQIQQLEA